MINSESKSPQPPPAQQTVEAAIRSGARGAMVLAGIAAFIVIGVWFCFYMLVFLPRVAP